MDAVYNGDNSRLFGYKLLRENIWFEDIIISLSLFCYVLKLSCCQPLCSHLCLLGQIRAQYSCGSANIHF